MSNAPPAGAIQDDEWLARYVVFSKWIRSSDNTVKSEAFLPFPDTELSVFRHIGLSEAELWGIGVEEVAGRRGLNLHGRADFQASYVRAKNLQVRPDDPPNNHALITGWPREKSEQKLKAIELASSVRYLSNPTGRGPVATGS